MTSLYFTPCQLTLRKDYGIIVTMSSGANDTKKRILMTTWRLLEEQRDGSLRMSDIAAAAGVSRQALYLHFSSRTDLLIATTRYGDGVLGLAERLRPYEAATSGVAILEAWVAFWGNYIPEIYGVGKALLAVRDTDEAAAAAWSDRMNAVRDGCRNAIEALQRDGILAPQWSPAEAVDLCWTMLSVRNWEQLTLECGWTTAQYVERMQALLLRTFVRDHAGA